MKSFFREKDQANASLEKWYFFVQTEKNCSSKNKVSEDFWKFQNEKRAD